MFVIMKTNLATPVGTYRERTIYNVAKEIGREWVEKGLAVETIDPPEYVAQLLARCDEGLGGPTLFLPFVGEFGHEIMSHVRIVHFSGASRKVVCCRPGNEVLYPSADEFVTEWRDEIKDIDRIATMPSAWPDWSHIVERFPDCTPARGGNQLTPEQEIFAIHPDEQIPFTPKLRGLKVDVVLGVRRRDFAPERNWPHWQLLADAIRAAGLTFAVIGEHATSLVLDGQYVHSGDHDTDAAIELLQGCRLYVGGDSGNSHLAATVGAPMLVVRETAHCSRDLTPRMAVVNPNRVEVLAGGWEHPQRVVTKMMIALSETAHTEALTS